MKRPKKAPKKMSARQYLLALKRLGLTPSGERTERMLGMGLRQCQRIGAGTAPVPKPVELLLKMYLKHGMD